MRFRQPLVLLIACVAGCAETGQQPTSIALFVAGSPTTGEVVASGEVPVTLERADLAFGPLYLCGGTSAGDLCDTARLEWLNSIVIDTLDSTAVSAGELSGFTGPVRSWMYDLGISSQLTRSTPYVLSAAQSLEGASLVLEGVAVVDTIELPFAASVSIAQNNSTELGVPVIRKSASNPFIEEITEGTSDLLVQFDPAPWVRSVDFRPYVANDDCQELGPDLTCNGTVEHTCSGATQLSSRDCADFEEVCIPDQGCASQLTIEIDSEGYRGIRNALVSGPRPFFEWNTLP